MYRLRCFATPANCANWDSNPRPCGVAARARRVAELARARLTARARVVPNTPTIDGATAIAILADHLSSNLTPYSSGYYYCQV